jgi:hypothetical protein
MIQPVIAPVKRLLEGGGDHDIGRIDRGMSGRSALDCCASLCNEILVHIGP